MTTPTPPPSGTGFDTYLGGSTSTTTTPAGTNGLSTLSSAFPSSYGTAANYPGISDKYLSKIVPGSGTSISDIVSTMPAGVARDSQGNFDEQSPTATIQQMLDNLLSLSQTNPSAAAKLQDSLILGGYLDPYKGGAGGYTPGGVVIPGDATWDAFAHLLVDSVRQGQSYSDILNTNIANGAGEKKFDITRTSSRVDLTNPQTAKLALAQVLQQELGRQPTNAEIAQYAGQLTADETANPAVTSTNYDVRDALNSTGGGNAISSIDYGGNPGKHTKITSSGGVDPTAEAQNFVMSGHGQELAQAQGDSVYQLFLSMLGGSGSAG